MRGRNYVDHPSLEQSLGYHVRGAGQPNPNMPDSFCKVLIIVLLRLPAAAGAATSRGRGEGGYVKEAHFEVVLQEVVASLAPYRLGEGLGQHTRHLSCNKKTTFY
jgi:hypothetical protein